MGRNGSRHADRNALRPVHEDIRDPDREDLRFLFRLIEIRSEIHNILVEIGEKDLLRDLHEPRFRVSHRGCPVSLDRSEIPVSVHEGLTLFEGLRHDDQGIIDRAVAVRMVLAHGVADDTG